MQGERDQGYLKSRSRPGGQDYRSLGSGVADTSLRTAKVAHDGESIGIFGLSKYSRCVYGEPIGVYGLDYFNQCKFGFENGSGGGERDVSRRLTETYAVVSNDTIILCDTDISAFTVTLPAGKDGKHYRIINVGTSSNNVTVDGNGDETVQGAATKAIADGAVLDLHYNSVEGWW